MLMKISLWKQMHPEFDFILPVIQRVGADDLLFFLGPLPNFQEACRADHGGESVRGTAATPYHLVTGDTELS